MNRFLLLLCMACMTASVLHAQPRLKRKGDDKFESLAYAKAIPYYLKYWDKTQDPQLIVRIAECYRLIRDYDHAYVWLDKAMALPVVPSETYFFYGQTLMQQQRYADAKKKFEEFSILEPADPRGRNYVKAIANLQTLMRDSTRYTMELLDFNTPESEFGAIPYKGGLLFSAAHFEGPVVVHQFDWLEKPFLDMYFSERIEKGKREWSQPKALTGEINTRFHESSITFFPDSTRILFTRNNFDHDGKGESKEGVIMLKIYEARIEGREVKDVKEININNDNYNLTHPCLSPDGNTLYFVSNMPGGFGGSDLYVSTLQDGGWSTPKNMGPEFNTPGNEVFPFIHRDGTFYFSSDGHPGLGGLDVFEVRFRDDKPVLINMGYPLNSAFDDFAVWMDETRENGYVSSDRPGGRGEDDIYAFTVIRPRIEIIVEDSIAKMPIENAQVFVRDFRYNTTNEYKTDLEGRISFQTDFGEDFSAVVKTIEFDPKQLRMNTNTETGQTVFTYYVRLYNPPPAITALVVDDANKKSLPGAKVELVKMLSGDTIKRVSDRNGRFSVRLEKNTYYKMIVRADGYLTYTSKFSTSAESFDGDTIIPMKLEKIPFNKPIVLENIHYDFDKWTIRADAYNSLIYLGNLLKDNPSIIVELSSHTDSRGADAYNLQLSQKRANAARIFLLDMGIEPNRIIAKGYGETKLVNQCKNGVKCSEEEHYKNRRTEFKVIGTIEGIDMEHSVLDTRDNPNGQTKPYIPEGDMRNDSITVHPPAEQKNDPNFRPTQENIAPENQVDIRFKTPVLTEEQKKKLASYLIFIQEGWIWPL